jgi:predicted nucleotidyltransferase component of viral defense system
MKIEHSLLQAKAAEAGFQEDQFEKVCHLVNLLAAIFKHPFLKSRMVLKGGTALNLFIFDMPRLSVDIDLNYIGAIDRKTMLEERPKIDEAIRAVCEREGLRIKRIPNDHAGGKWRLSYDRAIGSTGTLELDLNFMLRQPLWRPERMDSPELLGLSAQSIPVLTLHELAAGKMSALFSRSVSRDLFDTIKIMEHPEIDVDKLRFAFVAYGGMIRRDWRSISVSDVGVEPREVEQKLLPMLMQEKRPARKELLSWTHAFVDKCRELVSQLLPFSKSELEFLDHLNEYGEIRSDLLTSDLVLQKCINTHPALRWKAQNVRQYRKGNS